MRFDWVWSCLLAFTSFFRDSVTELVEYYFYVICKKQPVFLLSYFRGEWVGVSEIGCALSWWRWSDSANKILEDR